SLASPRRVDQNPIAARNPRANCDLYEFRIAFREPEKKAHGAVFAPSRTAKTGDFPSTASLWTTPTVAQWIGRMWSILPHAPDRGKMAHATSGLVATRAQANHVMANFDHSGSRSGFGSQRATVKWFNATKGFGFVTLQDGSDAFCHAS